MSEKKEETNYSEYYIINLKIFYSDNKKNQYNYLEFFRAISQYKNKIDVTSTFSSLIEKIQFHHKDTAVSGQIIYGSNIKKLYDTNTKEELEEHELREFQDKLANNKRIQFIFIPECHRIVIKKGISINTCKNVLCSIVKKYLYQENIDNLTYDIVIEQSKDRLNTLLTKDIKQLNIYFGCSNGDNISDEFARLFDDDTKESKARQVKLSYTSENKKDSFLQITDKMKAISKLATENGKVEINAIENGKTHKYSTTDTPNTITLPEKNNMELKTEEIRNILIEKYRGNQDE